MTYPRHTIHVEDLEVWQKELSSFDGFADFQWFCEDCDEFHEGSFTESELICPNQTPKENEWDE